MTKTDIKRGLVGIILSVLVVTAVLSGAVVAEKDDVSTSQDPQPFKPQEIYDLLFAPLSSLFTFSASSDVSDDSSEPSNNSPEENNRDESATEDTEAALNFNLSDRIDTVLEEGKIPFLFFYADWCGYSQQQMPILEELSVLYEDQVEFIWLNVDEHPEEAEEFDVWSYPTMFLIYDKDNAGYIYEEMGGYTEQEELIKKIEKIIEPEAKHSEPLLHAKIESYLDVNKSVFLFFHADGCHYCDEQKPIIDELEQEYADEIAFIRVNADENPEEEFSVAGFPTMVLIHGKDDEGYFFRVFEGYTARETLEAGFERVIEKDTLAVPVGAEQMGTITVYVKDQDGNNVYDSPFFVGNIDIDLFYEGELLEDKSVTMGPGIDHVIIPVNHTGTYNVRAIATFEIVTEGSDSCWWQYDPYDPTKKIDVCSPHYCGWMGSLGNIDEKGVFECEYLYSTVYEGVEGDHEIRHYRVTHRYLVVNEIMTYVDVQEADNAYLVFPTRKEILEKYGKIQYDDARESNPDKYNPIIHETEISVCDHPDVIVAPWQFAVDESIIENGIQELLEQPIEEGAERVFEGAVIPALIAEPVVTIIYIAATDTDNFWSDKTAYRVIGSTATGVIVASITAGGPAGVVFAVGVVAGVATDVALDYAFSEGDQARLCKHAETDDLDIFIGLEEGECTPADCSPPCDFCEKYPVTFVNKGVDLYEVGVDKDADNWSLCSSNFGCEIEETLGTFEEINDRTVEFSYSYCVDEYPTFETYARLLHKIEVLPGLTCNFDTNDLLIVESLDYPLLTEFRKENPYISHIDFQEIIYSDEAFEVSASIIDVGGILNADISWDYLAERGGLFGQMTSMQKISESGMKSEWEGSAWLEGKGDGLVLFSVIADDHQNNPVEKDNDQRYYKIDVIEDADSGGDVASDFSGALDITSKTLVNPGELIEGYLVNAPGSGYADDRDMYKFEVQECQYVYVEFKSETDSPSGFNLVLSAPASKTVILTSEYSFGDNCLIKAYGDGYGTVTIKDVSDNGKTGKYEFSVSVFGTPCPTDSESGSADDAQESTDDATTINVSSVPSIEQKAEIISIADQTVGVNKTIDITRPQQMPCTGEEGTDLYIPINKVYFNFDPLFNIATGFVKGCTIDENDNYECTCVLGREHPELNCWQISEGEWTWACVGFFAPAFTDSFKIDNSKNYRIAVGKYSGGVPSFESLSQEVTINPDIDWQPEIIDITADSRFNEVAIKIRAKDEYNNLDEAEIYIDDTKEITDTSISGGTLDKTYYWDTSALADASTHTIKAQVEDTNSNWAESYEVSFQVENDNTPPEIISLTAAETSSGNVVETNVSGIILLLSEVADNKTGLAELKICRNELPYVCDDALATGGLVRWNTQSLDGQQTVTVTAKDNMENSASQNFIFNIDNTPPTIDAIIPADNDVLEGMVTLEVNATDSNTGVYNAEWFLNTDGGRIKIGSGKKTFWGAGGLNGSYTLTLEVGDLMANKATRDIPVTIISPDLAIAESDIAIEGNEVTVTVHNIGSANASNVAVEIFSFNGSVGSGTIESIAAGASETLTINITELSENMTIVVDPYNHILEIEEMNNFVETGVGIVEITLHLTQGQNLISIPIEPIDPNVSSLFGSTVSSVKAWNGSSYVEVESVVPMHGYWVEATKNALINITGYTISNPTLPLIVGWNLVGPADYVQLPLSDPNIVGSIWTWDGEKYVRETLHLEPTKAYWIAKIA